jgi:hypothetical protein
MSNLEEEISTESTSASSPGAPTLLDPRRVKLTTRSGVTIDRTLPHRDLKRIGAWVFLDAYGPTLDQRAMQVAAHPHTGLQTVTWLISGRVLHHDSIGSKSTIRSGELNLMTAGRGIAHSELSLEDHEPLQGVQLWVALPDSARNNAPTFEHFDDLPRFEHEGSEIRLFMGELMGRKSQATTFTPLVGAEITLLSERTTISLNPKWEHGILLISDHASVASTEMKKHQLLYLPVGSEEISLEGFPGTRIMLIGGELFDEKIVMWWNFIGRSHDEIVKMREAWESDPNRFPSFQNDLGGRIPAPVMPNLHLVPR